MTFRFYFATFLLFWLCNRIRCDYNVTFDDTHDQAYRVIEPDNQGANVSDEHLLTQQKGQPLSLAVLRGWAIFLILLVTVVALCTAIFVLFKVVSRSSRGLMERLFPGIHITKDDEAISAGRCTRVNF